MNIAQNVCFFAKDIFQLPQNILYRLKLIYFATFAVEKKTEKTKKENKKKPVYPYSLIGVFLVRCLL